MGQASYKIATEVVLDEWAAAGMCDVYARLGMPQNVYTANEILSSFVHDLLHATAQEMADSFHDRVSFRLTGAADPPLSPKQLTDADHLERAWIMADRPARREFLRRIEASELTGERAFVIRTTSPETVEVIP